MSDTVALEGGRTFRVLGARVAVRLLAEENVSDLIAIPDTVTKSVYRRGVIVAVGTRMTAEGAIPADDDLQVGDHCVLVRFHANIHTNEQVQEVLGKDMIVVAPKDIILVCEPGDTVVFT